MSLSSFINICCLVLHRGCTSSIIWFQFKYLFPGYNFTIMIDCARYFLFFFFVFCLKLCFKMIAVSKRCWFDPNINSVCTEDHICTVSFYTTIAENKFCLHSLSNRNHFKTWNIYIRCSFVLFDGHLGPLWLIQLFQCIIALLPVLFKRVLQSIFSKTAYPESMNFFDSGEPSFKLKTLSSVKIFFLEFLKR